MHLTGSFRLRGPFGCKGGSLSDSEAVDFEADDATDSDSAGEHGEERRGGRWYGLLAAILLLLLLLCCATTTVDMVVTRGPQQARFIARNLACLQCHTEQIPNFTKATVHSPFMLRDCTVCHTKHGSQVMATVTQGANTQLSRYRTLVQWLPLKWWFDIWGAFGGSAGGSSSTKVGGLVSKSVRSVEGSASALVMPGNELCWMCHGDMGVLLADEYTHVPFVQGRCTECHDPHASDYKALLTQAPNKICFTCHPMGKETNRMQAHPPAKQGWCTDCHSPHASNNKGMLIARQRELCFTCHPSVASMSGMATQHQPFKNDNCTGCHEPHGSDNTPLLIKPQPALCYTCHPQIENQFDQPSHHPVGLNLTCASCHNPHASEYPGLLSGSDNQFCFDCHGDKRGLYEGSAHSGSECVSCHTPHGSQYYPMLLGAQPRLCLRCHPAAEGSNTHPVRPTNYDLRAHRGLTCTSSCHNPHGTENEFMVKDYDRWQDGMCLQCHKTVGVYY
jgi:predicted CXXCH cytochrome family protein